MSPPTFIDSFTSAFLSGLFSGSLPVVLLFFILRHYLSSYLTQKGRNLSDKEDLRRLTAIVESVKAPSLCFVPFNPFKH
jgi:hypothetical protein